MARHPAHKPAKAVRQTADRHPARKRTVRSGENEPKRMGAATPKTSSPLAPVVGNATSKLTRGKRG